MTQGLNLSLDPLWGQDELITECHMGGIILCQSLCFELCVYLFRDTP